MDENKGLMQQLSGWCEELLLRGLSQFTIRDVELLEQCASTAQQLQMQFLNELISNIIEAGRRVALGEGQEARLLDQYCRLAQYVQLNVQSQA
ncbi:hypothetical protein HUB98_02675 [Paenibacillus barcinonensis]|uniref:Uncharacterized protein n=1 Tax=Paenibacillus barcinonensis TaxID=198119 RepID=A0A2V4V8F3_PAEBA|nr:hypothetical protein [Paenibacillus barcinonensis]PYE49075.1 hypothetical protein DFQ00_10655 [Paenibacillus barcinonensis]QKS55322.1 hypothetical protein HUB98_02675 [Paenibacillus barcinonensis]